MTEAKHHLLEQLSAIARSAGDAATLDAFLAGCKRRASRGEWNAFAPCLWRIV